MVAGDPVDAGTTVSPEDLAAAVGAAGRSDDVDALVVVFVPPLAISGTAHAVALRQVVVRPGQAGGHAPSSATQGILGRARRPGPDGQPDRGAVPSYPTPERAVAALGRAVRYSRWRTAPPGEMVRPAGHRRAGRAGARRAARRRASSTSSTTTSASRSCAATASRCCRSGAPAAPRRPSLLANELGFPVAIKATAPQWRHRVDGAGVRLMVITHQGARQAFADLSRASGRDEVYVQRMGPPGTSCVFALLDDPSFGSLLSFGLSGHGLRAARRPRVPAVAAVDGRRGRADPRAPGGAAAVRLPRRAAGPAGRAGRPRAAAEPAGRGPARGPVAGAGPGAGRAGRRRRVRVAGS